MLYSQISDAVVKQMKQARESNLFKYLNSYNLTAKATHYLKDLLDFNLNFELPQRKMVELGQALSRVISMEMVLNMGDNGFRKDLIDNSIATLQKEISGLIGHFNFPRQATLIEDYQENSVWYSLSPGS
jgi:hypothetical protein